MSKNRAAQRTFWLIATRTHGRMEVMTIAAGGEVVLPIFSFQEESELFLHPEAKVADWSPRETTTGELASLLLGLCARVDKVALDPLPGLGEREILGLLSTDRRHFLHHLLGELATTRGQGSVRARNPPSRRGRGMTAWFSSGSRNRCSGT